jgi:hypothetical protein
MRGHHGLIALALLVVVAAACNATGATPIPTRAATTTHAPVTAAPVVVTPEALRGTWTADVQGTTASSGIWTMEISSSNVTLQNPASGDLFSLGPTFVSETSLVLGADPDCPDQATVTPGTYTLALAATSLVISVVSDSCGDRTGVLVASPWTRKP